MSETAAELYQRAGYDLVMRLGTDLEKAGARARRAYVQEIRRQTENWLAERRAWLAEQQRGAA